MPQAGPHGATQPPPPLLLRGGAPHPPTLPPLPEHLNGSFLPAAAAAAAAHLARINGSPGGTSWRPFIA